MNDMFKEDLINHFAIGKELGQLDGNLRAYSSVLDMLTSQPEVRAKELIPELKSIVNSYVEELEKYND